MPVRADEVVGAVSALNEIDLLKMAAAAQRRAAGPESLIAKRIDELIAEAEAEHLRAALAAN